jgi:VanZ family protein
MSSFVFDEGPAIIDFNLQAVIYHIGVFFFFSLFLLFFALRGEMNSGLFFVCFLIAVLYGVSDELHQYFVPGRYCCIEDVLLDSSGISLASLFYFIRIKNKKKNK